MSNSNDNTPAIYVGTYGQYNNGSLYGRWFDLTEYSEQSEFYNAIAEYHKKEHDPEFMFQDWENIPSQFIGESYLSDEFWDYLKFIDSSYLDQEAIDAGLSLGIPLDKLEEAYYGQYDSDTDLAYEYIDSTGMLSDVPDSISNYFDYESFGRDLAMDFIEEDGYYFLANW